MTDPATLVVLCGLSFAGKSTLATALARQLDADIVSLDAINGERGLDGGQGIPIEEQAATNDIAHERAADRLRGAKNVVVDDTSSPKFLRDEWRAVAEQEGARFALVWVRIDEADQRMRVLGNRARTDRHDVTDAVLDEHIAGFEAPGDDELVLVIDAADTRDASVLAALARAVLAR